MRRPLPALPLLVLSLAACGDGVGPTAAAPSTTPPAATETAATPSPAPTEPRYETKQFVTPSGGTTCSVSEVAAVCEVKGHTWDLPPKPKDCDLDWAGMVEVRAAEPRFLCAGDTGFGGPPQPVLAYGDSTTMGAFRCTSARTGVTCENQRTGHGFTVSRAAYRLY